MNALRLFAFFFCASSATLASEARHIVVVVWDGMRPDFVSEKNTPALWKLAREGVTFRHHHAAYLSATVVNGATIATGCYPSGSGVFANYVFRPEIDSQNDRCRRAGRGPQRRRGKRRKISGKTDGRRNPASRRQAHRNCWNKIRHADARSPRHPRGRCLTKIRCFISRSDFA